MNFRVGQKVVCVDDKPIFDESTAPGGNPVKGQVYTVANIFATRDEFVMLELVEIWQPGNARWYPGFDAQYFRPAVERKTDISIFTRMLTPKKQNAHT